MAAYSPTKYKAQTQLDCTFMYTLNRSYGTVTDAICVRLTSNPTPTSWDSALSESVSHISHADSDQMQQSRWAPAGQRRGGGERHTTHGADARHGFMLGGPITPMTGDCSRAAARKDAVA